MSLSTRWNRKAFGCCLVLALTAAILSLLPTGCGAKKEATEGSGAADGTGGGKQQALLTWPTVYRDARRTGRGAGAGPDTADVLWTYNAGSESDAWAVLGKEDEILCGFHGKVVSIDAQSGAALWEFSTAGESATACCVAEDGTIYFGAGTRIHALTPEGSEKWSYELGYKADEPVADLDGTVYAGSVGGKLVALNPDGTLKWEAKVEGDIRTPAIGKDALYCGASPFVLYAYDKKGYKLWECRPEGEIPLYGGLYEWANSLDRAAIGDDGTIYVGSLPYPGYTTAGQAIPGYAVPAMGKLYAVSPQGQVLWKYQPQISGTSYLSVFTPSIGRDGTLYAGTSYWRVLAVDSHGRLLWEFNVDRGERVCPSVYSPSIGRDGLLYAATSGGKMFCINPDGTEKWSYDSGSPWLANMRSNGLTPPPLGKDGTLFTVKADGRVYAFRGPATK